MSEKGEKVSYASQPPTTSSTVPDSGSDPNSTSSTFPPLSSLSESEFAEGLDWRLEPEGFDAESLQGRLLDIYGWDYYGEGLAYHFLDQDHGGPSLLSQPQNESWESNTFGSNSEEIKTTNSSYPTSPASKLPAFQPQSNSFVVNPRYPIVPAPVQAREIPQIQQQILDERHIHLFQSPPGQYHQIGIKSDEVESSSVESSGQVDNVSSTTNIMKHNGRKQTKGKRKRCGECIGCQRKDNCGDCRRCGNDKSPNTCKMRRCEELTNKK